MRSLEFISVTRCYYCYLDYRNGENINFDCAQCKAEEELRELKKLRARILELEEEE